MTRKFIEESNENDVYAESHRLYSYDYETGILTRKAPVLAYGGAPHPNPKVKVGDVVGSSGNGYLNVWVGGKLYLAHRIIWLMHTGSFPKNGLDHINGDKLDNRISNLRECNQTENNSNRGKTKLNKTGYKGVSFDGGSLINPYKAQIQVNKKKIHLGLYPTPEDAYSAYCMAAKKYHGEFVNVGDANAPVY